MSTRRSQHVSARHRATTELDHGPLAWDPDADPDDQLGGAPPVMTVDDLDLELTPDSLDEVRPRPTATAEPDDRDTPDIESPDIESPDIESPEDESSEDESSDDEETQKVVTGDLDLGLDSHHDDGGWPTMQDDAAAVLTGWTEAAPDTGSRPLVSLWQGSSDPDDTPAAFDSPPILVAGRLVDPLRDEVDYRSFDSVSMEDGDDEDTEEGPVSGDLMSGDLFSDSYELLSDSGDRPGLSSDSRERRRSYHRPEPTESIEDLGLSVFDRDDHDDDDHDDDA